MQKASLNSQLERRCGFFREGFFARVSLMLLASLFLVALAGRAQDTATIVGTVTDTSGAVVPNCTVTVSNPDRGFVRVVQSNSAGEYAAARIPIGNYVITAEMTGFQKLVHSGISLNAGQEQRVDLTLTVGQVAQQISVSGNVTKVETESATLSSVITSKQIQNLTLNGLNFGALTFLVPGAAQDNGYSEAQQLGHAGAEVGVSFNGNREEYSQLELDGGNNAQESSTSMGGAVTPAIDMIAEFRISTSNYGADVGQHAGALVEIATKGGTKQFHGDAYEFVRNDAMDANDWFANQQIAPPGGNAPKTPLKWNIFGYTIGGPFYIPHHYNTDKSKTFFFWSQEWARYRQASVVSGNVPTPQMRQGDFSQCDPSSGSYVPLLVEQGCVLPSVNGAPVDSVSVHPNGAAWLNGFVPLPNNGIDGYIAAHSVPTNFSQKSIRVDQNINDKMSLFVRFTNDEWAKTVVPALWSGSSYDSTQSIYEVPARQTVLHINNNLKPTLLNEFIMSYTDTPHFIAVQAGPGSPAHSVDKPLDLGRLHFLPGQRGQPTASVNFSRGRYAFQLHREQRKLSRRLRR
ncbi:MAG TPA: carboxypeptidase-like regulatory domain-containing protein [Terriglobia bacterium]|nr:carboxypeptidase-like regulatory domain-containing protein [Terriglobia bacterium]